MSSSGPEPAPALRLRVAGEMAAIEDARRAVGAFLAGHTISARALYKLELVLEEMLMNRAQHAFAPGVCGFTDVQLEVMPDALLLRFEDDGVPFDPLQVPLPQPSASLEQAQVGGLGLLLTRKAARECRYERSSGRNRFTVVLPRQ